MSKEILKHMQTRLDVVFSQKLLTAAERNYLVVAIREIEFTNHCGIADDVQAKVRAALLAEIGEGQ